MPDVDVVIIVAPIALGRDFIDYPWFADLGPIQAASVLRARGLRVKVVDAFAQPGSDLHRREADWLLGVPVETLAARLPKARAYVVGMNPFLNPLLRNAEVAALVEAARAKSPGARVIVADCYVGGQHYIDYDPEALRAQYGVDAVAKGEAEEAIHDLVVGDGRIAAPLFGGVDLARAPWPDWKLVDRRAHAIFLRRIGRHDIGQMKLAPGSMPLLTTRGCVYRCAFCTSAPGHDHRRRVNRVRPLDEVARHVAELVALGARHLHVLDELANFDADRFARLLEILNAAGIGYEFPNGLRADGLEPRHLELMKGRVGFFSVSAESASSRVLNELIEKGLDPREIERVARECHARAIPLHVHWQIGTPGETKPEINATLEEALRLRRLYGAEPLLQFATPIEGTRLARAAREAGQLVEDVQGRIGPLFQRRSVLRTDDFSPADLAVFMRNFQLRMAAEAPAGGARKVVMNATGDRFPVDGELEQQKQLLRDYRARGADRVDFDGGEPTLYPHIFELIRFARAIGYRCVCVTTNGRRSAERDFARTLTHSGITDLRVSLYGADRATHERMIDSPGSFELTLAGARNCLAVMPPDLDFGIKITVGKGNYAELPRFAAFVHAMGARKLNIHFITPFGRANAPIGADPALIAPYAKQVIDRHGDAMNIQLINLPWCYLPGYERFMASDVGKRERNMATEVQLDDCLAEKRRKTDVCRPCAYGVLCDGFYVFEEEDAAPPAITAAPPAPASARRQPPRLPVLS
ncbi:MAG: radical SAM protein [Myxococcota bacterium]